MQVLRIPPISGQLNFLLVCFLFFETCSHMFPDWPWTCNPLALASQVLRLRMYIITLGLSFTLSIRFPLLTVLGWMKSLTVCVNIWSRLIPRPSPSSHHTWESAAMAAFGETTLTLRAMAYCKCPTSSVKWDFFYQLHSFSKSHLGISDSGQLQANIWIIMFLMNS